MSFSDFNGHLWDNPAHNIEAERSVLGVLLLGDRSAMEAARTILSSGDFYFEPHRNVFNAAVALADGGREVDIVTVQEELSRRGVHERTSGMALLASLFDSLPVSVHVEDYAQVVRLYALWRGQ